jgi:cytochrome b561
MASRSGTSAEARYSAVAIALHWLIALAVLALIAIGLVMTRSAPGSMRQFQLFQLHKSIGITVLALSLCRLAWRLSHRPPALPATLPAWQRALALATHGAFYILIIGMPLTGWAMVSTSPLHLPTMLYGRIRLPDLPFSPAARHGGAVEAVFRQTHDTAAWIMIALVALHIAAALKHHFVDRDAILRGMLPWR